MTARKKIGANARTQTALGLTADKFVANNKRRRDARARKHVAKAKRARPDAESERLRKLGKRVEDCTSRIEKARVLARGETRERWLGTVAKDLANAVEYLAASRWKDKAKK